MQVFSACERQEQHGDCRPGMKVIGVTVWKGPFTHIMFDSRPGFCGLIQVLLQSIPFMEVDKTISHLVQ